MIKIERKPIDQFVDIYNMAVAKKELIENEIEAQRKQEIDEVYLKISEINEKYDAKKVRDTAICLNLIQETTEEVEVEYPDEDVVEPTDATQESFVG